jgi:hypothetical protein
MKEENMTRQNSRPPKKKYNKQHSKKNSQPAPKITLDATVISQFTASSALKAQIHSKRRETKTEQAKYKPYIGTVFASGVCDIGTGKNKQTYVVRITNTSAAEEVLRVLPGTQIRLPQASFVESYSGHKNKEVSSSSYVVITDSTTSTTPTNVTSGSTGTAPSSSVRSWFIYPANGGTKEKNGVTVRRPLLHFYATR